MQQLPVTVIFHSLEQVDKTGTKFVTVSTDHRLRVYKFKTGKLMRTYDESIEVGACTALSFSPKRPLLCLHTAFKLPGSVFYHKFIYNTLTALLQAAHELQRSGHEAFVLEDLDFGRCALSFERIAQGQSVLRVVTTLTSTHLQKGRLQKLTQCLLNHTCVWCAGD